jgi:hypothetical protein
MWRPSGAASALSLDIPALFESILET